MTPSGRRFLARHPDAEMYAGFKDFHFYRWPSSAPIWWRASARSAGFEAERTAARRQRPGRSEAGIVSHMNEDHADAVQLYAGKLLGLAAATGG
jgi:putative heme iron utilization protein